MCFQRMPKSSSWMQRGVVDRARSAALVGHVAVEVDDLAEAVAAELERVGQPAEAADFAAVEGVLEVLRDARIAVWHDHFGHRGAVADGPQGAVVVVGDLVQHEAFAGVQRDAHLPLLPLQQVTVERERDALGLDDVERLEVGAWVRRGVLAVEAQRRGRDRHGGLFEHLQHLVVEQVDDGHDALNGASVAVVVLGVAQVGDGLEDAVFGLPLVAEVAGRPGVDLDRLELLVGDALALHRSAPRGVTLDGLPARARTPPSAGRAGHRCALSTIRRCRC